MDVQFDFKVPVGGWDRGRGFPFSGFNICFATTMCQVLFQVLWYSSETKQTKILPPGAIDNKQKENNLGMAENKMR
jgi:hypothetical protein